MEEVFREPAELKSFVPGTLICLNDVMTGIRKLARVSDTGNAYIDLDDEDCTPMPIYAVLRPEEVGNMLGWGLYLVDHKPELHPGWAALCEQLVNSGEGVLLYNRAAHWAFQNLVFDYDRAMDAAKAETAAVARGRKMLDDMARNAGGLE